MNMGKCIHMRELSNRLILLITLLCVFFTGCTTAADIDTDDENAEKKYNYIYDKLTAQSSVSSRAAFGDDGYYFLANGILYYYDMSDADAVPVCSKAECSHKDEECDAYIYDNAEYDTYDLTNVNINCLGNMIWFEDGNLYMIKRDKSGDYLMQYDSTFKNERTVCTLAEKGTTVGGPTATTEDTAVLYNGYLYYFTVCPVYVNELVDKNYYITFYCNRVKVSQGAKPEVLGRFDAAMDVYAHGRASLESGHKNHGAGAPWFLSSWTAASVMRSVDRVPLPLILSSGVSPVRLPGSRSTCNCPHSIHIRQQLL